MRILVFTLAAMLLAMSTANAAVRSRTVEYKQGDTVCEGYLAWDDAQAGPRPGVLVVHEWMGLGEHVMKRCNMLAEEGYVAFAADIYGKGVRPTTMEAAAAESGKYRADRKLLRARAQAGLDQLLAQDNVDKSKVAAIGYCFGGMTVLELARAGTDINGIVSFHGSYGTENPAGPGDIKAKVLICNGAADPHNPREAINALEDELNNSGADWQFINYGHAMHSFTNERANSPENGLQYNAEADRRSWQDMLVFFNEIFG
jgi:dienelactone hydrolase